MSNTMVTLPQAKRYLNIQSSDADDFLREVLDYTYGLITDYCGREFALSTNTDLLKGTNSRYLNLTITPVKNITSVKVGDKLLGSLDYGLKNKMLFYKNGLFYANYEKYFPNGLPDISSTKYDIEVVYDYGFQLPSIDDLYNTSNVPLDLQFVTLDIIKLIYMNSGSCPQLKEKNIQTGGEMVAKKYAKFLEFGRLTRVQRAILDTYKKRGEF